MWWTVCPFISVDSIDIDTYDMYYYDRPPLPGSTAPSGAAGQDPLAGSRRDFYAVGPLTTGASVANVIGPAPPPSRPAAVGLCQVVPGHVGARQPVYTSGGPLEAGALALRGEFVALVYSSAHGRVVACKAWVVAAGPGPLCRVETDKGQFVVSPGARLGLRVNGTKGASAPVLSLSEGRRLLPCVVGSTTSGYARVSLQDGVGGQGLLHRMVASEAYGVEVEGLAVHHENERPLDCRPENLRVMTPGDHARLHAERAVSRGVHPFQRRNRRERARRSDRAAGDRAAVPPHREERAKLLALGHRVRDVGLDVRGLVGSSGDADGFSSIDPRAVERAFGSVDAFVAALDAENHAVVRVSDPYVGERFAVVHSTSSGVVEGAPIAIWPVGDASSLGSGVFLYGL